MMDVTYSLDQVTIRQIIGFLIILERTTSEAQVECTLKSVERARVTCYL